MPIFTSRRPSGIAQVLYSANEPTVYKETYLWYETAGTGNQLRYGFPWIWDVTNARWRSSAGGITKFSSGINSITNNSFLGGSIIDTSQLKVAIEGFSGSMLTGAVHNSSNYYSFKLNIENPAFTAAVVTTLSSIPIAANAGWTFFKNSALSPYTPVLITLANAAIMYVTVVKVGAPSDTTAIVDVTMHYIRP